jgi:hypothetical protein
VADYAQLSKDFKSGRLLQASRKELEHYATMVCLPGMAGEFPAATWPQVAETVRLMLLVRISEETQNEALAVVRRATRVSQWALWLVLVQIVLALPPLIETVQKWRSLSAPPSPAKSQPLLPNTGAPLQSDGPRPKRTLEIAGATAAMSAVLAAIFAFIGSLTGHFIANYFDAARKRHEVRRAQIEKFAEALTEDRHWLELRQHDYVFGETGAEEKTTPYDRAWAVYLLYFKSELSMPWTQFMCARHDYLQLLMDIYGQRLRDATFERQVAQTHADPELVKQLHEKARACHAAYLECFDAASDIAQETIPRRTPLIKLWDVGQRRLRQRLKRPTSRAPK